MLCEKQEQVSEAVSAGCVHITAASVVCIV